jgi:putative methyltransferase (TIGR04325 family)
MRRWVPPAIADYLDMVVPDRFKRFQVVSSWVEAEHRCLGYEQSSLKEFVCRPAAGLEGTYHLTSRDLQLIAAVGICLEALRPGSLVRVLDFGGGRGHYFDVALSVFPNVRWEWTVVETPTMVTLAARTVMSQISWTSDLDSALDERWDLVFASASLNYVPDPAQILAKLGRAAPYALLTRLPLWPVDHHVPAIQRISRRDRGGAYPTWVFSEADFLEEIQEIGDVVFRFDVPEDTARIAGHRNTYTGLLIQTRELS